VSGMQTGAVENHRAHPAAHDYPAAAGVTL
jgi:hypothetical protein